MILKDGSEVEDPRLDRLYEEDWNSLNFPVTSMLETVTPYDKYIPVSTTWYLGVTLDQGQEGACVGAGFTHEALSLPYMVTEINGIPLDMGFAREKVYWESQKIDEWPGGSYPEADPVYEGTSVLSGAKAMQSLGLYREYYWALDLKQLALAIGHTGPAVMGLKWYEGMSKPTPEGYISPTGKQSGAHCILARGVEIVWADDAAVKSWENVDQYQSYFILRNSWGASWGINGGDCYISFVDMEDLLLDDGDACIPSRVL